MCERDLIECAKKTQDYVVQLRHALHEIPEIGWREEKTMALIESEIQKISQSSKVKVDYHKKEGGVWVDLNFHPKRERILYRADVDALPIEEQTHLPFSSKHLGMMHACGHDCHVAMLLGALKILTQGILVPYYNLRLVWQRSEEIGGITRSGGMVLVEEGVLEGISRCYGLHISSTNDYGIFFSKSHHFMCQPGVLQIEVTCPGSHVMCPERGSNAIDIMNEIHMALRGYELRMLGPDKTISFVSTLFHAGNVGNICPNRGEMSYALRSFLSTQCLKGFISSIRTKVELIVQSYPDALLSRFIYSLGCPPLINDPSTTQFVRKLLGQYFETREAPLCLAGEDFAYYMQHCIGSYWVLGAKREKQTGHHTATFNPDEGVLWQGVAFWLLLSQACYCKN